MDFTMYNTLLQLPLFQGISRNDLTVILDKVKFEFIKLKAGEKFITQGEECSSLLLLLNGTAMSESNSSYTPLTFCEFHTAPYIFEPYSVFGISTRYRSSYIAETDINLLKFNKLFIHSELANYDIFRINYFNILCNRIQNDEEKLWRLSSMNIEARMINLISTLSETPVGRKVLRIKMEGLAGIVGETRINVSRVLNEWELKGLVELRRKEINIFALENLIKERG